MNSKKMNRNNILLLIVYQVFIPVSPSVGINTLDVYFQIQFLRGGAGPGRHIFGKDILITNPGQEVSDIRTISIVSICFNTEIIVEND